MSRFSTFVRNLISLSKADAKRKQPRKPRKMLAEQLEKRECMAANITVWFNQADRILHVEGTENADLIYITNQNNLISVGGRNIAIQNGGSLVNATTIPRVSVTSVQVDLLGGNDFLSMLEYGTVSPLGMTVTGGSGDDLIEGGSARDLLYGGLGNDTIYGKGGGDLIVGGYNTTDTAVMNLDKTYGFYDTDNFHQNTVGLGEKWFKDNLDQSYYITPAGSIYRSTSGFAAGTLIANVDSSYHADVFSLVNASKWSQTGREVETIAEIADKQLGLHAPEYLYKNLGGKNEKYLLDKNNAWHFILPNGGLYKLGATAGTGTLLATLSPDYYNDISKLVDAQNIQIFNDNDRLVGGADNDAIYGYAGNDVISGEAGSDYLYGGDGNDTIWGALVDNVYSFTDGTNSIYGDGGNDQLYGGNAADKIFGGAGNDGLFGGGGSNVLQGDAGSDRFINWSAESNTFTDRSSLDATIQMKNSPAMTNATPPSGWPNKQQYNFNAGTWTAAEITSVDVAFNDLMRATNNTKLLRMPNGTEYSFTRRGQQTSGDWDFGGQNDGAGNIVIGQLRAATLDILGTQQIVYHEIGHSWFLASANSHYQAFLDISGWQQSNTSPGSTFTASIASGDKWWFTTFSQFARPYGQLSPHEDYATTWETYFTDNYRGNRLGNTKVQAKYDNLDLLFNDLRTL